METLTTTSALGATCTAFGLALLDAAGAGSTCRPTNDAFLGALMR